MAANEKLPVARVHIEAAYPVNIAAIYFDRNGNVLRIEFSDDTPALKRPGHLLMEQSLNQIDLIGMYHLPAHYIILRNRNNDKFIYGFRMPSCKNVGYEIDHMEGEMVLRIEKKDKFEISVEYPGRHRNDSINPFHDLFEGGPLQNVDLLMLRSYTLLEYKNRETGEILCKVIESNQYGSEGGAVPEDDMAERLHSAVDYSITPGVCSYSAATTLGLEMRRHGAAAVRGIDPPHSRYYNRGRFGRLFPTLPPLEADPDSLIDLGAEGGIMDGQDRPPAANPGNPDNPAHLPAGFTYLGQFIDHDITFDPTSSLEREVDPEAVTNFRSPTLELDSVYGAGPGASPHLYQRANPAKLLIGRDAAGQPNDLPRSAENVALIGDPRNDENLIVSQLHLAFLKFHNAAVDEMRPAGVARGDAFREAQRRVRWHYQWMIVHEFLPHIIGEEMVAKLLADGREFFNWRHEAFIPVEFSVAAYRFGHSQVRPGYRINADFTRPVFATDRPIAPDGLPNDLSGRRRIRPEQVIDWRGFFQIDAALRPQIGKAIDTKLSTPLFKLPFASGTPADPKSLAVRNLLRHLTFGLPSGQNVARAMQETPLDPEELQELREAHLDRNTPLWFYILKEAELRTGGTRLGPVGGRIVGEVLVGLLEGDRLSYLRANRDWTPDWAVGGDFKMANLLKFAGVA